MFTNKHVVLALIIAPILALIAYFAIDLTLSEKPQVAEEGKTYRLAARSNCRYTSGVCALENGDFKLKLRSELLSETALVIKMTSAHALEGAKISLGEAEDATPINMEMNDKSGLEWIVDLPAPKTPETVLRLVVKAKGTLYYGESPTTFVEYKTFFTEQQNQ
ncbi:hypothetical protein [Veronia pacifica]|uniref:Uncharacterized protein n=1 Tax=Veronia pacifica TaxID=1080227 RepID=A0A1C3EC27_9GAMM|nr:hypothetical protein [Veronia pacifica]ODA30785.1 hypothetical protein A8L45_19230 [Veronia pacifica]